MKELRKARWAGWTLMGIVVACAPRVRELGDEPRMSTGGSRATGGGAGSGMVPENGGTGGKPSKPGSAGNGGEAGAPPAPKPCFSPTRNTELLFDHDAVGCPCDATDPVCLSDLHANPPWYAELMCEDGRWKSVPPSCDSDCFSPRNRPELALAAPDAGCGCTDEPPECLTVSDQGRPHKLSLQCVDGRWRSVEDGVCGDGTQADCRVDGVTYPSGARGIPNPLDSCNTCACKDGRLDECTIIECPDTPCPEGSFYSRRCVDCGPTDACTVFEIGCFTGPGCETGTCHTSMCG